MKFSTQAAALLLTIGSVFSASASVINAYKTDFTTDTLNPHRSQNGGNISTWVSGGYDVLNLKPNSWFVLNLKDTFGIDSLNVNNPNSDVVLDFDFRMVPKGTASAFSEIAGIWAADFTYGMQDNDPNRTFHLGGTQNFGLDDFTYTNGSNWQSFSIKLDDYISGVVTDLVFINDCDHDCGNMNVRFRNTSISEVSEPTAMSLILLGIGFMGWRARRQ